MNEQEASIDFIFSTGVVALLSVVNCLELYEVAQIGV